jgi:hypothetical protein
LAKGSKAQNLTIGHRLQISKNHQLGLLAVEKLQKRRKDSSSQMPELGRGERVAKNFGQNMHGV